MEQVTITLRRDDETNAFSVSVECDPPVNHLERLTDLQVLAKDFEAKVTAMFADTELDEWEPT